MDSSWFLSGALPRVAEHLMVTGYSKRDVVQNPTRFKADLDGYRIQAAGPEVGEAYAQIRRRALKRSF